MIGADPDVRTSVTVAHNGSEAEPVLVTFVEAAPGRHPDAARLRERAARSLPRHLVPAAVQVVERMPRTTSARSTGRALPAPVIADDPVSGTPPRTDLERRIAAVFAAVTGHGFVPRETGFFDLGGTSMGAVRVVARLRTELGRDVALAWLFTDPTVAGLAARIEHDVDVADPLATLVPLNRPEVPAGPACSACTRSAASPGATQDSPSISVTGPCTACRRPVPQPRVRSSISHATTSSRSARCNRTGRTTSSDGRSAETSLTRWRFSCVPPEPTSAAWFSSILIPRTRYRRRSGMHGTISGRTVRGHRARRPRPR